MNILKIYEHGISLPPFSSLISLSTVIFSLVHISLDFFLDVCCFYTVIVNNLSV